MRDSQKQKRGKDFFHIPFFWRIFGKKIADF